MDSTALAVLGHFIVVVAAFIVEKSTGVPVSNTLVVNVTKVVIITAIIDYEGNTASVINPA